MTLSGTAIADLDVLKSRAQVAAGDAFEHVVKMCWMTDRSLYERDGRVFDMTSAPIGFGTEQDQKYLRSLLARATENDSEEEFLEQVRYYLREQLDSFGLSIGWGRIPGAPGWRAWRGLVYISFNQRPGSAK